MARIDKILHRWLPIMIPLSLVIGALLYNVGGQFLFIVPFLFAFMTFMSSLRMNFSAAKVFINYPIPILFSIAFLHLIMPLWAYGLTTLIYQDHLLTIGFVISVAIPTGVTSILWVNLCQGNMPLSLSIILIDTLLSPVILPILLKFFVGETIAIDTASLIIDLLWMIVLPSALGIILHEATKGRIQVLAQNLAPFSKISLFFIVMINSSAVAPFLANISWELVGIVLGVFLLSATGYLFALLIGHLLFKNTTVVTTLVFICGMRNIPIGIIIATTYFPAKVAMPVVFCMLFQQILASLFDKVVRSYQGKYSEKLLSAI